MKAAKERRHSCRQVGNVGDRNVAAPRPRRKPTWVFEAWRHHCRWNGPTPFAEFWLENQPRKPMLKPSHLEELERTGTVVIRVKAKTAHAAGRDDLDTTTLALAVALNRLRASAARHRCPDCGQDSHGLCPDCAARRHELAA